MKMIAKTMILVGIIFILLGIFFYITEGKIFYKRLPGDIFINKENIKIFIPITTMLLLSVLLSIILNIIFRLFK